MDFELCAEHLEAVSFAEKHGFKRVELCAGLSVGGLTPSPGLAATCAKSELVEIHCMIRHREGNFYYNNNDIEIMLKDMDILKNLGIKGFVFGCLKKDDSIDIEACNQLIAIAKENGLEATFHRAFDFCKDPFEALEILIELGFTRILTSGQKNKVFDGLDLVRKLVKRSNNRIQVMAGSGVNAQNAKMIADTGIHALHFTSYKSDPNPDPGMGSSRDLDEEKSLSIIKQFQN